MAVNNIQITQGTQTSILTDNTGGAGGTLIGVVKISTDAQGTFNGPWNGAVTISAGTINVSTISTLPNLPGGSIAITAGTINAGTVNLGTIVGKDANAAAQTGNPIALGGTDSGGTIRTVLVNSSGALSVTSGTFVNISTGTLTTGSISNVAMLNAGTLTTIPNIPGGTLGVLSSLTNGSIVVTAGTNRLDGRTTQNILSYGTQVSGTAAIAATIIGSTSVGAGTSLWLQDVSVTNNNANVLCTFGFGTAQQGTNVLLRANLGTSGAVGIEKSFAKAVNAGMTNQDLVFSLGAAGTIDLAFSYFISA